ncbi:MAG: cytochrome c biogenesis protein CcdA [Rhodobacteraceae bacterium]|jgi:cytochrome c-type biogenesis protein|nr:cytochrome c biogenesis protein CcdA [uncultured Defluviimonas sp.]MCC0070496.1 cytochrome c biogenesis protein CcdA [Paracoccaceae bacterium]
MLETGIMDAGFALAALIALLAGVLSFLSPCVLPIVPPYLAYMGGITMAEMGGGTGGAGRGRNRALVAAIFFVLGLSTVFLFLGFTASAFGQFFLQNQGWFNTLAGIVVMVFGAHFLGVIRIGFLNREARLDAGDRGGSAFGAYLLGLAFAFGWTPCIGPQLGMILALAAQDGSIGRGTALLAVYAIGLGIPFLLVAAFFPRLKGAMAFLKRHMDRIERIMGLLLWTIGLLMLTGEFSQFSYWLLETFPGLALLG